MKTHPITYYARRCDITGQGINTGYVWRHLGRITATGQPSEAMALKSGFETLEEAIKAGHVVFKAWTDPEDVTYYTGQDGTLKDLDGQQTPPPASRDLASDFADLVLTMLPDEDAAALSECLALGRAVMKSRAEIWRTTDTERHHAIASMYANQLACAIISQPPKDTTHEP